VQVQVLFHLSRGLRDLGEFEGAAEALDTCCGLDRGNDPPTIRGEHTLASRAELHLRRGDLDAALAAFCEARDLDPSSSYLWERLGRVYELRIELESAEAAYRRAIDLPRGSFAYLALGRFHLQVTRDLPAAAVALVGALQRLPGAEPLVRLELARLHLLKDRPEAAYRQVERALAYRRENGFAEALKLAAELAERLGRGAEASRYREQLARLNPNPTDPTVAERAGALVIAPPPAPCPPDAALPPELAILEEAEAGGPAHARQVGIVDRFFAEKGFGFLHYDQGQSIFFHVTQCECDSSELSPGTRVSFRIGHNPKKGKPQAEAVRREE
jgi:Tfp pilus assembly protein PilF/cold shock CspA family protein